MYVSKSMLPVGVYMKCMKTKWGLDSPGALIKTSSDAENRDGLHQEGADPRCCGLLFLLFLFLVLFCLIFGGWKGYVCT